MSQKLDELKALLKAKEEELAAAYAQYDDLKNSLAKQSNLELYALNLRDKGKHGTNK